MSDYIDRSKVLEIIRRTSTDYSAAFSEISRLPAADVTEVVHARWTYSRTTSGFAVVKCTNCNHEEFGISTVVQKNSRCPHCGAIMDEEAHS